MEEFKLSDLSFGDEKDEVFDAFKSSDSTKDVDKQVEAENDSQKETIKPEGEDPKDPEIVAEGNDDNQGQADKAKGNEGSDSSSPKLNDSEKLYSKLATHFLNSEVLSDLDPNEIKSLEDLKTAFSKETEKRLDYKQKAISEAMKVGVPVTAVSQKLEGIEKLEGIDPEKLRTPEAQEVRFNLMVMDAINKGYDPERAKIMAQRNVDAGTDIDDATYALKAVTEFEKNGYQSLLKEAQDNENTALLKIKKEIGAKEGVLPNIILSTSQQEDLYKKITTDVGNRESEFVQYQKANPIQSRVKLEALFHLTKGLTDFSIFSSGAKTEANEEFETLLRGTNFTESGKIVTEVLDPMSNFALKDLQGLEIGES